jgi:hypothetical protein
MTFPSISNEQRKIMSTLVDAMPDATMLGHIRHQCQQVHQQILGPFDILSRFQLGARLDPKLAMDPYARWGHCFVRWLQVGIRMELVREATRQARIQLKHSPAAEVLATGKFGFGACIEKAVTLSYRLPFLCRVDVARNIKTEDLLDHTFLGYNLERNPAKVTPALPSPNGLVVDPTFNLVGDWGHLVRPGVGELEGDQFALHNYISRFQLEDIGIKTNSNEAPQQMEQEAQQVYELALQLLPKSQTRLVDDYRSVLQGLLPAHTAMVVVALERLGFPGEWGYSVDHFGDYTLSTPKGLSVDQLEAISSRLSSWRFTRHLRITEDGQLTAIALKNPVPAVWLEFSTAIATGLTPTVPFVVRSPTKLF